MKMEQFVPNLRGLNGDEDFPEAMLVGIYKSIEEHELKVFFFFSLRSLSSHSPTSHAAAGRLHGRKDDSNKME